MHGRLVLHRDLKTQNIFLLGNGRLVLGDLGISKVCAFVCVCAYVCACLCECVCLVYVCVCHRTASF